MAKAFISEFLHSLINHSGLPGIISSGTISAWSEYPATQDISAVGYTLSATTISAETYLNYPTGAGGSGDPSTWSNYPATAIVSAGSAEFGSSARLYYAGSGGFIFDFFNTGMATSIDQYGIGPTGNDDAFWFGPIDTGIYYEGSGGKWTLNLYNDFEFQRNTDFLPIVIIDRALGDVSASGSFRGSSGFIDTISAATYLNYPTGGGSGDPSTWSEYPATQNISGGGFNLINIGSGSFIDISATNYHNLPPSGPGADQWSNYPATGNISAGGYTLSATTISAATYQNLPTTATSATSSLSANYAINAGDASTLDGIDSITFASAVQLGNYLHLSGGNVSGTLSADTVSATTYLNYPAGSGGSGDPSTWSEYPATQDISAAGHTLSATTISAETYQNLPNTATSATCANNADLLDGINSSVFASGIQLNNYLHLSGGHISGTLSADIISAATYQNITTIPSAWASYSAVANISAAGYSLLSGTNVQITGTVSAADISASNDIITENEIYTSGGVINFPSGWSIEYNSGASSLDFVYTSG